MDTDAEKKYFLQALRLFYETQWLHNVPVTEILTKGCLDAIPKEWMERLLLLQNDELNNFVVDKTIMVGRRNPRRGETEAEPRVECVRCVFQSDWPDSLKSYVDHCQKTNRLSPALASPSTELPHNFRVGLSRKKQHEIMRLAHLVYEQCRSRDIRTIIDLGAGLVRKRRRRRKKKIASRLDECRTHITTISFQGYVCQMLHHLYGYRVLGLERHEENVNRACARQRASYPESLRDVRYIRCDVTCDSADRIESILQREFPGTKAACLIGLHACGDLSTSAARIFRRMKSARLSILISCCYHKLSVSGSTRTPSHTEKQYFHDFPMSDCLREVIATHSFDVGQFLRVPFLRLACQESADKWRGMSAEKHSEHSFHVLARAVLELYSQQSRCPRECSLRVDTHAWRH